MWKAYLDTDSGGGYQDASSRNPTLVTQIYKRALLPGDAKIWATGRCLPGPSIHSFVFAIHYAIGTEDNIMGKNRQPEIQSG